MLGITPTHASPAMSADLPVLVLPTYRLAPEQLAIIVNDASTLSIRLANYYQQRRKIPATNLIHVDLPVDQATLSPAAFAKLNDYIRVHTPPSVQAYALAWMLPYRVGCMSITSALTLGYDAAFCGGQQSGTCRVDERTNPYFNSWSATPFQDYKIRPAMMLAAKDWPQAKALVDRGVAADATMPEGTAYLVSTSDKNRNVRAAQYPQIETILSPWTRIEVVNTDALRDRQDVLFYFTGMAAVAHLDTVRFQAGAIADHLTSAGGVLNGSAQMSVLSWLEAGATGSYGTVVEPCNYPQKFPMPGIVMEHYLLGESMIEAYWKSVMWPREGVFVGEPLAAPFSGYQLERAADHLTLRTHALKPGVYQLLTSASVLGPFSLDTVLLTVTPGQKVFYLPDLDRRIYKLVKVR